jgi:hypothetical protein
MEACGSTSNFYEQLAFDNFLVFYSVQVSCLYFLGNIQNYPLAWNFTDSIVVMIILGWSWAYIKQGDVGYVNRPLDEDDDKNA